MTPSPATASTPATPAPIPDVQGSRDTRQIPIDKVGVKGVVFPMRLRVPECAQKAGAGGFPDGVQTTVATINMYVSLPHYQKGTHMSRFVEVLNEHTEAITPESIPQITRAIRERLGAADAHFEASFTYFVRKLAPVTGMPGMMDYKVGFECSSSMKNGVVVDDLVMSVSAPATSLCPCSKEISRYGAHNQRCVIEAKVRFASAANGGANGGKVLWIEDLVRIMEKAASMEVFAVLKRPDEKFVTEAAYENPKFVEDIVRDLALALDREDRVAWYQINSENYESIHNHNAYAQITRDKR